MAPACQERAPGVRRKSTDFRSYKGFREPLPPSPSHRPSPGRPKASRGRCDGRGGQRRTPFVEPELRSVGPRLRARPFSFGGRRLRDDSARFEVGRSSAPGKAFSFGRRLRSRRFCAVYCRDCFFRAKSGPPARRWRTASNLYRASTVVRCRVTVAVRADCFASPAYQNTILTLIAASQRAG